MSVGPAGAQGPGAVMVAGRAPWWRWAPLLAAVAVAVASRGGYGAGARAVVAVLAGVAVLAALAGAPEAAARTARQPVVASLAALALFTTLTAAWTIGAPADAVRDAVVVLALAGLVVAAAAVPSPGVHAGALLVAALGVAVAGLTATIATAEPLALDICGTWRPAGPFEYPPALALVCAGALPVALGAATDRRRMLAASGALTAWLLAITVALTANRTGVALAAAAVAASVALAPRGRRVGPVALALVVATAAGMLLLHGDLARAGEGARVLAVLTAAVVLGPALRSAGDRPERRPPWTALVVAAGVAATAAVVLADRGSPCGGDPSHGRVGIWRAAVATAAERPLQGFGAGTFLAASRAHQRSERPVPTRFAHDLGLQAWVEVGLAGLLSVLAWYAAVARTLAVAVLGHRARAAREAGAPHARAVWLLSPAVAILPLATLLDWPWELTGTGALWALATGGLLAGRAQRSAAQRPRGG